MTAAAPAGPAARLAADHPVRRHPLDFRSAPESSDHGLPLGDGLVGASLWGDGRPLNLSLDRADLWDLREIEEYHRPDYRWADVAEAHRSGRHEELRARLEAPYDRAGPTRLPAGRLQLGFGAPAVRWTLQRATGLAEIEFVGGARLEAFIDAAGTGRLRVRGDDPDLSVLAPPFGGAPAGMEGLAGPNLSRHNAWDLGYAAPRPVEKAGLKGFCQTGWGGFRFATLAARRQSGSAWLGAWTVAAGHEAAEDLIARAEAALSLALESDFDAAADEQARWWADYWSRGRVDLPDPAVEKVYYSGMHQFGAAARRGAPPAPLQGVWTSDDGRLPPWKGDYHHDLNTQMAYWPAYAGNQLEAGLGFLDWLWETKDRCLEWTRRFYGVEGLNVPMTADLANRQIGGWRQYTHSVATGAWLAHHFHLHWRYSQDRTFLTERALPYLTEVCRFIEAISETRDAEGRRSVALSSSPEVGDNRPEAWFSAFTNYDLSLFRWGLAAAADMAEAAGRPADAAHWRSVLAQLPDLALSEESELLVAPGVAYPGHHRHFSHAVAVHPLGLLDGRDPASPEGRVARATARQILGASKAFWMGYSYAWAAALAARIGDGAAARDALITFGDVFVFPNGFHANGDWSGRGVGKAPFGAFTLEGATGAADAVQTMLLQSRPGALELFPAIPPDWSSAGFAECLADGAVTVSATLNDGRITGVTLTSDQAAELEIAAFGGPQTIRVRLEPGQPLSLAASDLRRLSDQRRASPED